MRRWIFAALVFLAFSAQADRTGITDPIGGSRAEGEGPALPQLPPWLPQATPAQLKNVVAEIDNGSCEIFVYRGGVKYRVGKLPAALFKDDTVHCSGTEANQEMRIGLRSGTQMRLNKDTQIKILKYQIEERDAVIDLAKGSLSLLVRPGDNLELNTPTGTVGSPEGGEFEVMAGTPQIDGLVRTIQGEVWVRGKNNGQAVGEERKVPAWNMVRVSQSGKVSGVMRFGH